VATIDIVDDISADTGGRTPLTGNGRRTGLVMMLPGVPLISVAIVFGD
jgi:hypothetical protein